MKKNESLRINVIISTKCMIDIKQLISVYKKSVLRFLRITITYFNAQIQVSSNIYTFHRKIEKRWYFSHLEKIPIIVKSSNELALFLTKIAIRKKQTIIGFAFAIVNEERRVSMSDDCIHHPLRISPTSVQALCHVLLLCWRQLSHLFPEESVPSIPLDAMEIKATNWTIPGLSNVHLGISRNEFTARHTRCTCRCNLMQSRCVIDSSPRRHAFKLHEAFMLIARDLRSEIPIPFFVSLVKKCVWHSLSQRITDGKSW